MKNRKLLKNKGTRNPWEQQNNKHLQGKADGDIRKYNLKLKRKMTDGKIHKKKDCNRYYWSRMEIRQI